MTTESMKDFLSDLIEVYPGYKTRIIDQETFVRNWMKAFGSKSEAEMKAAAQIWVDKGNKLFPTIEEFQKKALFIVEFRATLRDQLEYERTHPTSETDQELLDYLIEDLFEGVSE